MVMTVVRSLMTLHMIHQTFCAAVEAQVAVRVGYCVVRRRIAGDRPNLGRFRWVGDKVGRVRCAGTKLSFASRAGEIMGFVDGEGNALG